ncbi:hypothetical protein KP79_PYT09901 [Mizuhopecten yessoensis]|uniref:SGNH hydrolase-type esterase domain-containing protein n=1 Tax=Mizuhopecten yessoensis TaxID=6573 RepID=A0A210PVX6_MIZYE|nr:hypothetical protein KP79_PYT09901 [Mizuhopecten yessoensis]
MTWGEFDPLVQKELEKYPPPDMIAVQLGSNDVVNINGKELIETIKCSFLRFAELSPLITIIWSEILPRGYWHGARSLLSRNIYYSQVARLYATPQSKHHRLLLTTTREG